MYTPSSMKIGELSHRIFSFIKAKFSSIATLRFKILTKIKDKNTWIKIRVSYWMEYIHSVFIFLFSLMKKETKKSLKAKGGCFAPFVSSLHALFQHLYCLFYKVMLKRNSTRNSLPLFAFDSAFAKRFGVS